MIIQIPCSTTPLSLVVVDGIVVLVLPMPPEPETRVSVSLKFTMHKKGVSYCYSPDL